MAKSVNRFSSRVENYAKYRPGYPAQIVELLQTECALNADAVIADVGSGTGILSEIFLKNGNTVIGIEPGAEMRAVAERQLGMYPRFLSVQGTAEETTLDSASVEFVTAAQAFHWFDQKKAKKEFGRILKPGGWAVLIWNERRVDSTPFLVGLENLLLQFGVDYEQVRHENVSGDIPEFFAPETPGAHIFDNRQEFDLGGLEGRIASASYTPEPGHPNYEPMMTQLEALFHKHAENGKVAFEYDTTVYFGHVPHV